MVSATMEWAREIVAPPDDSDKEKLGGRHS